MDARIWIDVADALAIHTRQLAEHGGADSVRDAGLLDSALARPRQQFADGDPSPDVPTLAAAYAFGIAKNHPFLDGNKRTAYVVCRLFLRLNGHDLTATADDRYPAVLRLAAGQWDELTFAAWPAGHTVRST